MTRRLGAGWGPLALAVAASLSACGIVGTQRAEPDLTVPRPHRSLPDQRRPATSPIALPEVLTAINESGPVVTPAQAREIVDSFWPLREQALANDDIPTTDRLETGVARAEDDALSLDSLRADRVVATRRERPHNLLALVVPRQDHFPAQFLAEVATEAHRADLDEGVPANAPHEELMVFTRAAAEEPWQLAVSVLSQRYADASPTTRMGLDDYAPEGALPTWTDPTTVHARLASYWQDAKDTGTVPMASRWRMGTPAVYEANSLAESAQDAPDPGCGGCRRHLEFSADPDVFLFAIPLEKVIVCSAVRRTVVNSAGGKGLLNQDAKRSNWGALVPPGRYRSITKNDVIQSCIIVSRGEEFGLYEIGGSSASVSASTDPPSS